MFNLGFVCTGIHQHCAQRFSGPVASVLVLNSWCLFCAVVFHKTRGTTDPTQHEKLLQDEEEEEEPHFVYN
jgi:hypothetical protein